MKIPALLLALILSATAVVAVPQPPPFPHIGSDLPVDPAVIWGTLDNGIRYGILKNTEPPGRISLRLHIRAGSLHEEENQRGLAHFLEHMAFNGTRNFKADELVEILQNAGIAFGADLNAYTSFDETVYMLDLPENKDPLLGKCLTILSDWADGMSLEQSQIEKERGVILSEKRDRDSVEMRIMEEQFNAILPDARVSKRFPIGTEEVISSANRDRFLDFYTNHYTPDRTTLIAVGDFDPAEMEKRIREAFGSMKPLPAPQANPDMGKLTPTGLKFQAFQDNEVKSIESGITSIKPYTPEPDTAATRAQRLPITLANSMLSRRLDILAKKEGSPIVSGSASSSDFLDFIRFTSIDTTAVENRWQEALAVAEQELRRALEHGFTQDELNEATANLTRIYEEAVKAQSTRQSDKLAVAITNSLHDKKVFTTPETDLAWLRATLPSVSPESCAAALRDLWSGDDRFVSITVKEPVENAEKAIADVYSKSAATKVDPPSTAAGIPFAYQNVGTPGTIVSRNSIEDLGITQWVLSNNIRVNFKKTEFAKNSIKILARFGAGKLIMPRDKSGLDIVAESIIEGGGLVAHSNDDLERLFAGKKVGYTFSVEDDAFVFLGETTRDNLSDSLRMLIARLQFPGYREEAERQFRNSLPIMAMKVNTTAEGIFRTRGSRYLKGGDTRFGIENPLDLAKFTTADVKDWLAPAFASSPMEISIVGDIDEATIEALILETLSTLPTREPSKPDYAEARVIPAIKEGPHRMDYESKVPKALNIVVWPTVDRSDIKRSRRVNVLADILGDRLRVKIREEMGEAYSPSAGSNASDVWKDDGFIITYSPGDPNKSSTVIGHILEIAAELSEKGVTQEELNRAINPILSGIKQQRRTNDYWLTTVLGKSQEKPEILDWARTLEPDHAAITIEEISALAREFLSPARARSLIISTPIKDAAQPPAEAEKKKDAA